MRLSIVKSRGLSLDKAARIKYTLAEVSKLIDYSIVIRAVIDIFKNVLGNIEINKISSLRDVSNREQYINITK